MADVPQTATMTPRQKDLARHALGLGDGRRRSYRNHFLAGSGEDHDAWQDLVAGGLATSAPGDGPNSHGTWFFLTEPGAVAVLNRGESLCAEDWPTSKRRSRAQARRRDPRGRRLVGRPVFSTHRQEGHRPPPRRRAARRLPHEHGTMTADLDRVVTALSSRRLAVDTETRLQADIAAALAEAHIGASIEHRLDAKSRIDFLAFGGIGIEAKIGGGRMAVWRQLERYAGFDVIRALVLVGAVAMPVTLRECGGKPFRFVSIGRNWL